MGYLSMKSMNEPKSIECPILSPGLDRAMSRPTEIGRFPEFRLDSSHESTPLLVKEDPPPRLEIPTSKYGLKRVCKSSFHRLQSKVQTGISTKMKIAIFCCGVGFATQFLLFKANAVDGKYPFKINNLYAFSSTIMVLITLIRKQFVGSDFLRPFTPTFLMKILSVSVPLALMDNISMFGLLYTSAGVAASIWYTKIIFAAIISALLGRKFATRMDLTILTSITITVFVYIAYSTQHSQENPMLLWGMMMILFSMLLGTSAEVFSDYFLGEKMTDVSMNTQFFWFALCMAPINFFLIFAEGYLYSNFSWYDFIPGYNYMLSTWILLVFWVAFNFLMIYVASYDLEIYICMSYTANVIQIILENALTGFADFDIFTFCFALIIYMNAISYQLSYTEEQRKQKTDLVFKYFQKHGLFYLQKLEKKAERSHEFAQALQHALANMLQYEDELGSDSDKEYDGYPASPTFNILPGRYAPF